MLGVDLVILPTKNTAPLSPAASKASAGAMELLKVNMVSDLPNFLRQAFACGCHTVGAVPNPKSGGRTETDMAVFARTSAPSVLVLGSEAAGLSSQVQKFCTDFIQIPQAYSPSHPLDVDSLNVSVTAGILLHQFHRERKAAFSSVGGNDQH